MKHNKFDLAYLKMALEWAKLSYCERRQVGALIVKDRTIISDGFNGTPSGFENCCEDSEGNTQRYVLHAEANAILKLHPIRKRRYALHHPFAVQGVQQTHLAIGHHAGSLYRRIQGYGGHQSAKKRRDRGDENFKTRTLPR